MKIGFLTCPGTHPGSPTRREDAYEHDIQVEALRPAMAKWGQDLVEIDWRSPVETFADLPLILVGTPWDYQHSEVAFLDKLDALEAAGHQVCNAPQLVRWNSRKTYLRDLAERGAATIPTIWVERATMQDIARAFDGLGSDTIVAKQQVGAGADGQSIHRKGSLDPDWKVDQPMMLQPFLPQIQSDGEYSFLFIDGQFSHALVKRPTQGDYRVQSLYGGSEHPLDPEPADLAAAQAIIDAIPHEVPLYARVDMVRSETGKLLVMEAEMIEPYLYPEQGPNLGTMMAAAIARRLGE
jgi:glutathione synthase/RimK-type ligase-like ATP-grasp enzyme